MENVFNGKWPRIYPEKISIRVSSNLSIFDNRESVCDGVADCENGSDEQPCARQCHHFDSETECNDSSAYLKFGFAVN